MYRKYYGFSSKPFDLAPNPDQVFMSETHQEALAVLRYGVIAKKGFLVLTGDVGTGKTTLLQVLVRSLDMEVHCCLLNNPTLSRDEFLSFLAHQYKLPWEGNKALFLLAFADFLKACHDRDERVLLIIDEAHMLPVELLEEVRLLSNQDVSGQDVFSIFLVGQSELNDRLRDERLLPLRQRIGIRFHLQRFTREETAQYISYRLRAAGGQHLDIFSNDAVSLIYKVSRGTPRLINIVCDHALLTGFADDRPRIGVDLIRECVEDLHLPGEETPLPVATGGRRGRWSLLWRGLALLLVIAALLLLLEALPGTREYSPLGSLLPPEWLQQLHRLYDRFL